MEPDDVTPSAELFLGAVELPESYIVPAWRDCFDDDFNPIPEKIRARIMDQGRQPSCVGHGTSVQKSAQEGVLISPRDIYRQAKRIDGDPDGWGTTLAAAQDVLVATGAAEHSLVDPNPNVSSLVYLADDYSDEVKENRKAHRGTKPFRVPRTMMRQAMLEYGVPVVTSLMWYPEDNRIGRDGVMMMPSSMNGLGHCVSSIGWTGRLGTVMVNSFGQDWGADGLFYVKGDVINRFGNAYITLDIEHDLALIIAKYEGKDVKVAAKSDHYRIQDGKRRKYPDEITWWAHGRLFGIETFEIGQDELDALPEGDDMSVTEAPFATRELVRQIRQYYGQR